MRPKTIPLIPLALLALLPAARGQEASVAAVHTSLSIPRPGYRAGQSFRFRERSRQSFLLDLRVDGHPVNNTPSFDQEVNGDIDLRYEVLAVDRGRVRRCRVHIKRLSLHHRMSGEPANKGLDLDGEVFTYERKGDEGLQILDKKGQPAKAAAIAQLGRLLPADPLEPRGPWIGRLPDRPLRIGERFECPRETLPRFDLALGMGLEVDRIELTLLRSRPHQGRPCALFAVTIRSKPRNGGGLSEVDTRFRVRGILLLDLADGAERLLTVSGPLSARGSQNNSHRPYIIRGDGRLKLRRVLEARPPVQKEKP